MAKRLTWHRKATLTQLSKQADFSLFSHEAEDVLSTLDLYKRDGDGQPTGGQLTVALTNRDDSVHVNTRLRDPRAQELHKRRTARIEARHLHLTDEMAAIHQLQKDVKDMKDVMGTLGQKMDQILDSGFSA